jgi:predicted RNA polymerase sigma factor
VQLITSTLRRLRPGPCQLQAGIAAVHDEAPAAEAADWPQILALYGHQPRVMSGPRW